MAKEEVREAENGSVVAKEEVREAENGSVVAKEEVREAVNDIKSSMASANMTSQQSDIYIFTMALHSFFL